jgi:transcription elongation factor Elf1
MSNEEKAKIPKLLNCPFCGSMNCSIEFDSAAEDVRVEWQLPEGCLLCYVLCGDCFAQGPGSVTDADAAYRWNHAPRG